ncbi:MAG: response regulator [Cypionkella sp.]|nr:response regulator [Cypionkella sp.]
MPVPDRPDALSLPSFLPRGGAMPDQAALPLSGVTILLVEDSRYASDMLRMMCQRSGARLRRAETMEQARAHLRTYAPDVVIVDLGLPDGPGERLIRELAVSRRVHVVLGLSGNPEGRATALAAGAAGFVDKPFPRMAGFQRLILRHLPGRFSPVVLEDEGHAAKADPLAFHDDLAHAADLMAASLDAPARAYLARFIGGVARSAGDTALATAAGAAEAGSEGMPELRALVRRRLQEGPRF